LRRLKKELTAARKKVKQLEEELLQRLDAANEELTADGRRELVLELKREALAGQLERYVAADRQQILQAVENFWSKCRVPFVDIEARRDESMERFRQALGRLGYDPDGRGEA
jgi:type I restriction enzyme M protein